MHALCVFRSNDACQHLPKSSITLNANYQYFLAALDAGNHTLQIRGSEGNSATMVIGYLVIGFHQCRFMNSMIDPPQNPANSTANIHNNSLAHPSSICYLVSTVAHPRSLHQLVVPPTAGRLLCTAHFKHVTFSAFKFFS